MQSKYQYREDQPVLVYHKRRWHHATTLWLSNIAPESWHCELDDGKRGSFDIDHMKKRERKSY